MVRDCDGAAILTLVMARHADNRRVQSAAAAAVRNIVSRNKELCAAFVERGVEELLDAAMEKGLDRQTFCCYVTPDKATPVLVQLT